MTLANQPGINVGLRQRERLWFKDHLRQLHQWLNLGKNSPSENDALEIELPANVIKRKMAGFFFDFSGRQLARGGFDTRYNWSNDAF